MMVSIFDVISMLLYREKRDEGQINIKVESIRLNKCNIYTIKLHVYASYIHIYTLGVRTIHSNVIVISYNINYYIIYKHSNRCITNKYPKTIKNHTLKYITIIF